MLTGILSNSGGRAAIGNQGNTGAPGDETLNNGSSRTCQNCHATGEIQVSMSLEILDMDAQPVNSYKPGELYTSKIVISHESGPVPAGYGFQIVSLFDKDNSDVNSWSISGHSTNVQINNASQTGRAYAEHKGLDPANEFLVKWQAPEAGMGDISFYAAGNGVNGNGASSGDGSAIPIKKTISESLISSSEKSENTGLDYRITPNPVSNDLFIELSSTLKSKLEITLINSSGQLLLKEYIEIQPGKNQHTINLSFIPKGLFWVQLKHLNHSRIVKIIKI